MLGGPMSRNQGKRRKVERVAEASVGKERGPAVGRCRPVLFTRGSRQVGGEFVLAVLRTLVELELEIASTPVNLLQDT